MRSSVPSTLQPPSVVDPPASHPSNSLTHALALPPPRPPESSQYQQPQSQPQEQQQQFIQPHAIYHNPPSYAYAGQPAQPPLQPQEPQLHSPAEESNTLKRKRGRPKGSKTKNRRVQGVLIPVDSLQTATSSSAPQEVARDDDDDDTLDLENPITSSFPQRQSALPPGTSDGAALGLGVGLDTAAQPESATTLSATSPTTATIKDFYDFQWRVMSLCSVFYESAGDLVVRYILQPAFPFNSTPVPYPCKSQRTTDPAVLAQSFSLGSKADPMVLLHNAKEFCDILVSCSSGS